MRYVLIMAGGSGVRLWPLSRQSRPKQLIPVIEGTSLIEMAAHRAAGLVPPENLYVCAAERHRDAIHSVLPHLAADQFLGEPIGRDTSNAAGLAAAVIARRDPDAIIAVFTADHVIRPVDEFQRAVAMGFTLAEQSDRRLVTFGIVPETPAISYGYLELGSPLTSQARQVRRFKEKPDAETARAYLEAGPERYLWNSGMFVWRASTLLDCLARYQPLSSRGLRSIADAWDSGSRQAVLAEVYPQLPKISVDYAVMESASQDAAIEVVAIPLALEWLDVGSWTFYGLTQPRDEHDNRIAAARAVLRDSRRTLVVSEDSHHLVAAIGCEDLIIVHTAGATLVCRADQAEAVKQLNEMIAARFGGEYL
jgi:mannose-1-phosphate guanylyltransferase